MRRALACFATCALSLTLASCGDDRPSKLDTLDNELADGAAGNSGDPAVKAALHDQIMVDPDLAAQANKDAIRPPGQPYSAQTPDSGSTGRGEQAVTLRTLAGAQKNGRIRNCAARIAYSTIWATRLPAAVPLYPDARVAEAAGVMDGDCALRIVSFASGTPLPKIAAWYVERARKEGYTADQEEHDGEHRLGGTRARDGAAYVLFMTPRGDGGTDIDLVASGG